MRPFPVSIHPLFVKTAMPIKIDCRVIGWSYLFVGFFVCSSFGQKTDPTSKRVAPPKWDKTASSVFFDDAFREALNGKRPQRGADGAKRGSESNSGETNGSNRNDPKPNQPTGEWSQLISATTIEDEIKKIKNRTDKFVTTPNRFKGSGYREARQAFSSAATLFGIIAEYDGQVRWKKQAVVARDVFARSAANAKVGTDSTYRESKLRKGDLQTITSGARLNVKPVPTDGWDAVVDRSPLMQRMQEAHTNQIKVLTSNSDTFQKNKEKITHEAEMLAAFAKVLTKEGMEGYDDEEYVAFCQQLINGAQSISAAVKKDDFELTRKANGMIVKACDQCHEIYQ